MGESFVVDGGLRLLDAMAKIGEELRGLINADESFRMYRRIDWRACGKPDAEAFRRRGAEQSAKRLAGRRMPSGSPGSGLASTSSMAAESRTLRSQHAFGSGSFPNFLGLRRR